MLVAQRPQTLEVTFGRNENARRRAAPQRFDTPSTRCRPSDLRRTVTIEVPSLGLANLPTMRSSEWQKNEFVITDETGDRAGSALLYK